MGHLQILGLDKYFDKLPSFKSTTASDYVRRLLMGTCGFESEGRHNLL